MRILSIGQTITHDVLDIINIDVCDLPTHSDVSTYDYIIINGGDGTIRRVMKILQYIQTLPPFILHPTGSFNVIAKLHRVPKMTQILDDLAQEKIPSTQTQNIYTLNKEVFLFSAGNMGDLQHIFLSETLRFGILKNGIAKYLLSGFFLAPLHLIITPFMLLSPRRFFIFAPASFIAKFGSFYGKIDKEIVIDLENGYNLIELDGDVVTVEESIIKIFVLKEVQIVNR